MKILNKLKNLIKRIPVRIEINKDYYSYNLSMSDNLHNGICKIAKKYNTDNLEVLRRCIKLGLMVAGDNDFKDKAILEYKNGKQCIVNFGNLNVTQLAENILTDIIKSVK